MHYHHYFGILFGVTFLLNWYIIVEWLTVHKLIRGMSSIVFAWLAFCICEVLGLNCIHLTDILHGFP